MNPTATPTFQFSEIGFLPSRGLLPWLFDILKMNTIYVIGCVGRLRVRGSQQLQIYPTPTAIKTKISTLLPRIIPRRREVEFPLFHAPYKGRGSGKFPAWKN